MSNWIELTMCIWLVWILREVGFFGILKQTGKEIIKNWNSPEPETETKE